MSWVNQAETDIMALALNATAWADMAENDSSTPNTVFYESFHTGSVGDAGNQTTSETTYTSYARTSMNRNSGAWTVASGIGTHAAAVVFPTGTGGSGSLTNICLGKSASGTGTAYAHGSSSPTITAGNGVTPELGTGTTFSLD